MKKIILTITSLLLAINVFGFVGNSVITAQAAGEYKNAVYERGVHATAGEQELCIFFYRSGKSELVYLNDGSNYAYTEYTLVDSAVPGHGVGQKLTTGDLVLYYYQENGRQYIMDGDGVVFSAEDMTAYEAQQIRDAF